LTYQSLLYLRILSFKRLNPEKQAFSITLVLRFLGRSDSGKEKDGGA